MARPGKTLQTIAFLAHLKFVRNVSGPHLVICPLSVLSSWMTELKRFCPSLRAIKLHSSDPEERQRLMSAVGSGCSSDIDVVVTTCVRTRPGAQPGRLTVTDGY